MTELSDRVISQANLSRIERGLGQLENNIIVVSNQVQEVSREVQEVSQEVLEAQSRIEQLVNEFREFVHKDQLSKNLQLAETRLVKVRQELENKFGHYNDVRRRAVGILQAVDASLVKKETIEDASEEQLLAAPRYWLAPCLIALAAWLNDNKDLAERAMMEGLRRNDEKTSLFFALVTRRGARYKASREWLDRYLGLQDPHELEREVVILIDGFANGVFGPEARNKCGKQIEAWIEELSQKAGFVEEQREQWKQALKSKAERLDEQSYPYLRKYSPTWGNLEQSLEGARLHDIIHSYFTNIFAKEIVPAKSIAFAVDALLDTLVTQFDEEELPLRKDERLLSLIVEADGERALAQSRFDSEKLLEERVSFTQLLTNFAMYPEVSKASLATQKLSLALSKEWIGHAHDDLTAENRLNVPIDIELAIDSWTGTTRNGDNEQELTDHLSEHMENRKLQALKRARLGFKEWGALAAGVIFIFMGIGMPFLFVVSAALIIYFFVAKHRISKARAKIASDHEQLLASCKDILRAVLADVVDYRRAYEEEDQKAVKIGEFLQGISPEKYAFSSHDTARSVITS